MTNSQSKMSSDEQRRVEMRHKMMFPPLPADKENKLITLKFNTTFGQETQITHWTLKRAGPPRDMIAHSMGYAKTIESVQLSQHNKAVQYRRLLSGTAVTAFDKAMTAYENTLRPLDNNGNPDMAQEPDRNNFTLKECLKVFIAQRTTNVARYNQYRGLQAYRKPRSKPVMDCHEWEDYFLLAVEAMDWLSGTDPVPEGDTLTRMYLDSYAPKWIAEFEKIHGTVMSSTTIDDITAFMHDRAVEADAAQVRNQLKQGTGTKTKTSPKKVPKASKYKYKKAEGGKSSGSGRLGPEDPCPLPNHDHPWGKCYNNINNPEAHKRRNERKSKSNGKGQNHSMEVDEDESSDGDHHAHQHDESDNEPGFIDGKSNGYRYPAFTNSTLTSAINNSQASSHYLDMFSTQDPHLKPSKKPGGSSKSSTPKLPKSSGTPPNPIVINANQASIDCLTAIAVGRATESILDPESDLVADGVCYSNNDVNQVLTPDKPVRTVPSTVAIVGTINGLASKRPLKVLFDPCSTYSHIYSQALPRSFRPQSCSNKKIRLLDTVTKANQTARLEDIVLPEFSPTRHISVPFNCLVSNSTSHYDIIFGDDFLKRVQIDPIPSRRVVKWMDLELPYREVETNAKTKFQQVQAQFLQSLDQEEYPDKDEDEPMAGCFATHLLESKYDKTDVMEVAAQQKHLNAAQREQLGELLSKYTRLFSGKLGRYPHRKLDLELIPEGRKRLRFQRHYPVAHVHRDVFEQELNRLVELGVLEKTVEAEFAAPTFLIPKKDGRVRWISDFRELNSVIKRKCYPLPKINDVLKKRSGYKFFTKLDISMQYYTFELTEQAQDLCVISTPFGLYKYKRAPMGVKQSPDFAQQVMEETLHGINEVESYIDDVGCFNTSWESHLKTLDKVLTRLQDANFTINPLKCEWGVQETDWLGYWLTPTGIKPWKKKVDAILKLDRPRSVRDVRSFVGAVTFYRELFPRRSHVLQPLHELTQKGAKWKWKPEHEKAFQAARAILARDVFIRYPDHNKPFAIYTDASDYQLGAVIMQEGVPVAYYSKKLNSAQRNYTTMEKELLSIVYTLQEYRTMLFGAKELHIHTDHKNLTYTTLNSQRVLRWRLFIEEFHPIFHYIKGAQNTLADALSRLPRLEKGEEMTASHPKLHQQSLSAGIGMPTPETSGESLASSILDDEEIVQCLLNFPEVAADETFALDYSAMSTAQQTDERIQRLVQSNPQEYAPHVFTEGDEPVVCHMIGPDKLKICIPDSMVDTVVRFYHTSLVHPGENRMLDTIQQHFENPKFASTVAYLVKRCDPCQKCKPQHRGSGLLPARQALVVPWYEIAVDLIGPWPLRDANGDSHEIMALTIIDTVTNLCEVVPIRNKTAQHIGLLLENNWLARYPLPKKCIYDQGNEFLGAEFQRVLRRHNIKPSAAGTKNPQANSVCERLHQSMANSIRILSYAHPPRNEAEVEDMVNTALQTASHAAKTAIHSTMKLSPGAMCFGRDMILDIPVIADFQLLQQRKEALINKNLMHENRKRVSHDYQIGDVVSKLVHKPNKLQPRAEGECTVARVHANGSLTINLTPVVTERINIRRVKPYRQ